MNNRLAAPMHRWSGSPSIPAVAGIGCLLLLLLVTACGRKGPLQPLTGVPPAAPAKVRLQQQGESLLLSWQLPPDETGSEIRSYRIDRLAYEAADGCPTCREPEETVVRIHLRKGHPALQVRQRLYWRDTDVRPGNGYYYRVTAESFGGRQGSAATVYRDCLTPPPPPRRLAAAVHQNQVALSWLPPQMLPLSAEAIGYNLYRRSLNGLFLPVPLNPEPLKNPEIIDRGLEPGREYAYRVSILVRVNDIVVESHPSAIREVSLPNGG